MHEWAGLYAWIGNKRCSILRCAVTVDEFGGYQGRLMVNLFVKRRVSASYLGAMCLAGACFAAQAQTASTAIPDFTPDVDTSWYFDRPDGDNYLLPVRFSASRSEATTSGGMA